MSYVGGGGGSGAGAGSGANEAEIRGKEEELLRTQMKAFVSHLEAGSVITYVTDYLNTLTEQRDLLLELKCRLLKFSKQVMQIVVLKGDSSIQKLNFPQKSFTIALKGTRISTGGGLRRCVVTFDDACQKITDLRCYE